MRMLRFVGMAILVLGLPACSGKNKNEDKLLGKWEVTQSKEAIVGTLVEFTKDGTVIQSATRAGENFTQSGTYKVDGEKIKVTFKVRFPDGEKDEKHTLTIKTLTDAALVTEDEKGSVDEYKRK